MVGIGDLFLPPLSTVQLPHYEIGRLSALHIIRYRTLRNQTAVYPDQYGPAAGREYRDSVRHRRSGYDNMVGIGDLFLPPLSTVQLPHYEIGRLSALHTAHYGIKPRFTLINMGQQLAGNIAIVFVTVGHIAQHGGDWRSVPAAAVNGAVTAL
jgi:hypothetical protein